MEGNAGGQRVCPDKFGKVGLDGGHLLIVAALHLNPDIGLPSLPVHKVIQVVRITG